MISSQKIVQNLPDNPWAQYAKLIWAATIKFCKSLLTTQKVWTKTKQKLNVKSIIFAVIELSLQTTDGSKEAI